MTATGRRAAELTALLVSVVLLAVYLFVAYRSCDREGVVGDYVLLYVDGAKEQLTLQQDGVFIQTLGGERHEGRWSYERHFTRSFILLDEQMIFRDSVYLQRGLIEGRLIVTRTKEGPALLMNPDTDEYYKRVARRH